MKKSLLFVLCLFVSALAFGQVLKGSGVLYSDGLPSVVPNVDFHSELAIDVQSGLWYEYSRDDLAWVAAGFRVQKLAGGSPPSGAPADKHSEVVLNDDEELFRWDGSAWVQINSGATYTAGAGISISGGNVISNTGDLSATNEIQTYGHAGTTSYTNTLSLGGGSFSLSAGANISISHTGGAVTITGTGDGWGSQVAQVLHSISGNGTSGSPLQLVNDATSPGNSKYYGTNGSGTKGFFDVPAAGGNGIYGANNSINSAGHTATIPNSPLTFHFTKTDAGVFPAIVLKAGLSDDQNHTLRFTTTGNTVVGDVFQFNGEQFIFHGKQGSATARATNTAGSQAASWNFLSSGQLDLPVVTNDPTVTESDFWYNNTSDRLKYRTGSDIKTIANLDDITSGGQSQIQFKDEGTNLGTSGTVTSVNVVGFGAEATRSGNDLTLRVGGFQQAKTTTLTSSTNSTFQNIPNFTFAVVNGRNYWWKAIVRVQTISAVAAPEFRYTAPASVEGSWTLICPKTTTQLYQNGTYQQGINLTSGSLPLANTDYYVMLSGWFSAFADGTFQVQFRTSDGVNGVGVFQNSRIMWGEQ